MRPTVLAVPRSGGCEAIARIGALDLLGAIAQQHCPTCESYSPPPWPTKDSALAKSASSFAGCGDRRPQARALSCCAVATEKPHPLTAVVIRLHLRSVAAPIRPHAVVVCIEYQEHGYGEESMYMTEHTWQGEREDASQRAPMPRRSPDRMWAGPATQARCTMCGERTRQGETEVEVEYDLDGGSAPKTYHLHARCFSVLERGRWNLD